MPRGDRGTAWGPRGASVVDPTLDVLRDEAQGAILPADADRWDAAGLCRVVQPREDLFDHAASLNYDCGCEAGLKAEGFAINSATVPGFSGQDPVIYSELEQILNDVYAASTPNGAPRVVVIDYQPDAPELLGLISTGLGGVSAHPVAVTKVATSAGSTTAALLVLLSELLAVRLQDALSPAGVTLPGSLNARIAALVLAGPAMLRWSYLLRDAESNRAFMQRIYAIELRSQEIMAVLSYHLHDSPARPLLITALGTRADANATPDLYARSLALVWLLKQYAHAISDRTKRGGYVDMDAANRPNVIAVLRQLGFRDAPRVSGFSPSGRHLRQDATDRR